MFADAWSGFSITVRIWRKVYFLAVPINQTMFVQIFWAAVVSHQEHFSLRFPTAEVYKPCDSRNDFIMSWKFHENLLKTDGTAFVTR